MSKHRTYRGQLEAEIRRTPQKFKIEEPVEVPVADYKQAAVDLQTENIRLEKEINDLKLKIAEEKDNYNREMAELFAESQEIQHKKELEENDIREKLIIVKKQLDEINDWYNDTDKIQAELQQAQSEADQIQKEKEIVCSILDNFITITQSIKDGQTKTTLLTSSFIQPINSCEHCKSLKKGFMDLKSIMIQRAFRHPTNLGDLQDF